MRNTVAADPKADALIDVGERSRARPLCLDVTTLGTLVAQAPATWRT